MNLLATSSSSEITFFDSLEGFVEPTAELADSLIDFLGLIEPLSQFERLGHCWTQISPKRWEDGEIEPVELGLTEWVDGRLVALDCFLSDIMNCNLMGPLPENIGELSNLEWVGLRYNQLTTLPESIGNMNNFFLINIQICKSRSLIQSSNYRE